MGSPEERKLYAILSRRAMKPNGEICYYTLAVLWNNSTEVRQWRADDPPYHFSAYHKELERISNTRAAIQRSAKEHAATPTCRCRRTLVPSRT